MKQFNKIIGSVGVALAMFTFAAQSVSAKTFKLTSSSVKAGAMLSQKFFWNNFGCTGENVSPALSWTNAPEGTKSYAITFYDQNAPTGSGFWHYQMYNIPASVTALAEGDLSSKKLPQGAIESNTDLGAPGYFGPCPPVGRKHQYVYTVYALPTEQLLGADGKPAMGQQTAALTGFFLWAAKPLGSATFKVKAGR